MSTPNQDRILPPPAIPLGPPKAPITPTKDQILSPFNMPTPIDSPDLAPLRPYNSHSPSIKPLDSKNDSKTEAVEKVGTIGVCAMDSKARSKACRAILNRLIQNGEFETIIFGDKVILDEDVENWPTCDFLICFFSTGFPLDKAIKYAEIRKPFVINDLTAQKILWDRRLVLMVLKATHVPTPARLIISRDGGPRVSPGIEAILGEQGVEVKPVPEPEWHMSDDNDTLIVDGKSLSKPFVEKPVDGEDHNIFIYYHSKDGGGGRRLFRKVGNKSSEYDPSLQYIRTTGSYIYEQFMSTDNSEDVKAYTVGQTYCHAETRKSPVVDGLVRRNTFGKEIRFVTTLTPQEIHIAQTISRAFKQTICGFDLLRVHGSSYVIDVNGFSFVKENNDYYDNCARILRNMFCSVYLFRKRTEPSRIMSPIQEQKTQKWVLKGVVTVIRHADRTPKQKFKYSFKSEIFLKLLKGHKEEVILRERSLLEEVLSATKTAMSDNKEDPAKLKQLSYTLEKKMDFAGTKIQIKPVINKHTGNVEKVQLIVKWGGEPTHSARYQAQDLGDQMRKDILLVNKKTLNDVKVFTSSERRVIASAEIWSCAFLDVQTLPPDFLIIRKDLLDDSNAAKELMDKVKKKIKPLLRRGVEPPPQFTWPAKMPEPFFVMQEVVSLMIYHRKVMDDNFRTKNVDAFQSRWCCGETPILFKERWDKLFGEFENVEKVDPSKISELYDTMKFDALHNRQFLEAVFTDAQEQEITEAFSNSSSKDPSGSYDGHLSHGNSTPGSGIRSPPPSSASSVINAPISSSAPEEKKSSSSPRKPSVISNPKLRELYRLVKVLFDYICPQEYGIEDNEKLDIGLLTSLPLVEQILSDLEYMKKDDSGACVTYFTKESHIYTLLNIIFESNIPTKIARNALPELDYLTQIFFELYESEETSHSKRYSIRLSISPGCHCADPLDTALDSKHCISCMPRRTLTSHLEMDFVSERFRSKFNRVRLPSRFIPVNIK